MDNPPMDIIEEQINSPLDDFISQVIEEVIERVEATESLVISNDDCLSETRNKTPEVEVDMEVVEEQPVAVTHSIDDDDDEGSLEYIVEEILDKRIGDDGLPMYLVKWAGYNSSHNTWEPQRNLFDCDLAMQKYEVVRAEKLAKKHGRSNQSNAGSRTTNGHKEYKVLDIRGLTVLDKQKYFLVDLANSSVPAFIRATLANRLFPDKVIDFYLRHLKWKEKTLN